MDLAMRDVLCVLGQRGSGKSTYVRRELLREDRCLVFDPHDEYPGRSMSFDCWANHLAERTMPDPTGLLRIVPRRRPQECAEDFRDFIDLLDVYPAEWLPDVLIIDECFLLRQHATEELEYLSTQSRHLGDGIALVLVAQRAVHLSPTTREQSNLMILFSQKAGPDTKAIAETCGEAVAAKLPNLGVGQHIVWRQGINNPPTELAKQPNS